MNPYSLDSEVFHKPISTNPHPRDILSPNFTPKQTKVPSLVKMLGALTTRKSCAIVAGGILVVGSIHMLRRGHLWLHKRRTSVSEVKRDVASRTDAGTQTDSLEHCTVLEDISSVAPDSAFSKETKCTQGRDSGCSGAVAPIPTTNTDQPKVSTMSMGEVHRRTSVVTDVSEDSMDSFCQCSATKKREGIPRESQVSQSCCQISIALSLLALHKACSLQKPSSSKCEYEKQRVCDEMDEKEDISLFSPGMKSVTPITRKTNASSFFGKPFIKNKEQSRNKIDASSQKSRTKQKPPLLPKTAERLAPFESCNNPVENQASVASEKSNSLEAEQKPSIKVSEGVSSPRQPCSEMETRIRHNPKNKGSGKTSKVTQNSHGGQKSVARSETHLEESRLGWRARPKKRNGYKKNNPVPRRQYVDLDNPRHVASLNYAKSWKVGSSSRTWR